MESKELMKFGRIDGFKMLNVKELVEMMDVKLDNAPIKTVSTIECLDR